MKYNVQIGDAMRVVELLQLDDGLHVSVDGVGVEMDAEILQPGLLSLRVGKRSYHCWLDETPQGRRVVVEGRRLAYSVADPRQLRRGAHSGMEGGVAQMKAPMPGRVVNLLVQVGDAVEAKQGVVVIEAMKMQNELKAPKAGRVVRIHAAAGDTVQSGAVLVEIE